MTYQRRCLTCGKFVSGLHTGHLITHLCGQPRKKDGKFIGLNGRNLIKDTWKQILSPEPA